MAEKEGFEPSLSVEDERSHRIALGERNTGSVEVSVSGSKPLTLSIT